ncbi:hypothetical protein [Deinococcus aquatilis]|uniref:hypothetical protein n=1 Tax=Deinococcus aquatilis TaxID=519440 RepID=UPI0003658C14|nr:hypothetical protein [Deinococcus aquatilis]
MELIATTRPEPVAFAYGASLKQEGRFLQCGWLLVKKGNTRKTLILRDPDTKQRYRVKLPKAAVGNSRNLRFSKEPLEVV